MNHQVMHEMGSPYSNMELASFVTASKGWAAECGLRGAFAELVRLSAPARAAFVAARGVMQCASVLGQIVVDCVVSSYTSWLKSNCAFVKLRDCVMST